MTPPDLAPLEAAVEAARRALAQADAWGETNAFAEAEAAYLYALRQLNDAKAERVSE